MSKAWVLEEDPTEPGMFLVKEGDKGVCCLQQKDSFLGLPTDFNRKKTIEHGRLLAAAPKLLKALKLAVELGRLPLDEKKTKIAFEKARAAIAEAEGEL